MEVKATAAILVCFHLFSEIENVVKKRKIFAFWSLIIKQKSATPYKSRFSKSRFGIIRGGGVLFIGRKAELDFLNSISNFRK